jgi:predicted nucleic acid-binding Zn ribbon protein
MSMRPVGHVLPDLLRELGLEREAQGWRAVQEWPRVVGTRIARRTRAVAFHDGTLHVEVEGSAWLQELGYLRRDLLRKLHAALGAAPVRELRFTIARGTRR